MSMENAPNAGENDFSIGNVTDEQTTNTRIEDRTVSSGNFQGSASCHVQSEAQPINNSNSCGCKKNSIAPEVRSFIEGVVAASADTALSGEGENYLNELEKIIKNEGLRLNKLPSTGSFVVSSNDHVFCVPFVFQETSPRPIRQYKSYSEYLDKITQESDAFARAINKQSVDALLITPQDYSKAKSMAFAIISMINSAETSNVTLSVLKGCRYRLVTDQIRAMENLRQTIPNGVMPYTQYAVSLEVANPNNGNNGYLRDEELNWIPLFTVGGYTEFIKNFNRGVNNRYKPFIPLVNISACAIRYMSLSLLPLIIRVAYSQFMGTDMWLSPFKHFNPNDINSYNLGQLILDTQGKPMFLKDSREFDDFVYTALDYPVLCLEITSGTLNYPYLSLIQNAQSVQYLKSQIINLVGNEYGDIVKSIPDEFVAERTRYYTGITRYTDSIVDTRTIDYFKICKSNALDPSTLDKFLTYYAPPESRIQAIASLGYNSAMNGGDGASSLYTTYKYILKGESVKAFLDLTSSLGLSDIQFVNRGSVFSPEVLNNVGTYLNQNCLYNTYSSNNNYGSSILNGGIFGGGC